MNQTSRMIGCLSIFLGFLVLPMGYTQANEASILSKFEGEWASSGDAFGQSATSTMTWSKALNEQFTRITYEIRMEASTGDASAFTGLAYYRAQEGGTFMAFWADNTGDLHPIVATVEENALISIWGVEGSKLGRTRYELESNGNMTVTDWIQKDGEWRQFNQNTFERIDDNVSSQQ